MIVTFLSWCAVLVLLAIAVMDARTQTIPDSLNFLLVGLGIASAVVRGGVDLPGLLLGLTVIGLPWLVSRGKWVGSGDVFLMLGIGLLLPSVEQMIIALMVSSILGGIVAVVFLLRGERKKRIALGPFLAAGAMVAVIQPLLIP